MTRRDQPYAKNWCFTLNNPPKTNLDCKNDECIGFIPDEMSYIVQGRETGDKGTHHLQGFVAFHKLRRLNNVKRILPGAHWEVCKGNPDQNRTYCIKDGDFCEHGVVPKKAGHRTDIDSLHETIRTGSSIDQIVDNHFGLFLKYPRAIDRAIDLYRGDRSWPMSVTVYWGESGTGKTKKAFEDHPDAHFQTLGKWWDGYEGHEHVIWDEFYGGSCPLSFFLKLTDRYPFRVPIKGGTRKFLAKTITFTSNVSPYEWYEFRNERLRDAFERRLTKVVHFNKPLGT